MQIPLITKAIINEETDEQMLEIWSTDGKKQIIKGPIEPYIISKKQLEFSTLENINEKIIKCKFLSNLGLTQAYKYEFPNTDYIIQINKSLSKPGLDRHQKVISNVCENHIPYINRILIDEPDFFTQFGNTQPLTVMAMDIETLRSNFVDQKTIISIAYSFLDGEKWHEIQSNQSGEKEILEWFLKSVETLDPSIICGYFHRAFDFPRIISRCKVHKLDYHRLGREHGVKTWINRRFNETNTVIPGRILYDILDSVMTDQTLFGIRNRKMKTVAEHFGIEKEGWTKEPMAADTSNIPVDVLKAHNCDDIRRTIGLYNIYWNNVQEQAEMFNIPLSHVAEGKSQTLIADIFLGRGLKQQNIYSDGQNRDRYPEIFRRQREKGEGAYEAAVVGIYLPGFHKKVYKIDFSGFYPSIMAAFNLSPDVCKIVKYLPYEKKFKSETSGKITKYYIPDKNINKVIVIAVRNDEDGFLRTELRKIRKERDIIKKAFKNASDDEKNLLESKQWNYKVLQNIPSGKNGEATAKYGAVSVSIATVGIARELMMDLVDYLNQNGQIVIEIDTDGAYITEKPDLDDINVFLSNLIAEKFNLKESAEISLDLDEYGSAYFIRMKNYILMNLNGEMTFHGVSMKSSRHPGIFVKARDILAKALLNEEKDIKGIINKLLKMEQYNLDDFTMRNTLHKQLSEYSKGSLQRKIGSQMIAKGIPVEIDTQIEYIKGKDNWIIAPNAKVTDINKDYYYKVVEKLCIALGFKHIYKTRNIKTLEAWF